MAYPIKRDYIPNQPVVANDLNARGDILASQLPGALLALGAGVTGAPDLLVTSEVAAGGAIILSNDGTPVFVRVPNALVIPARDANVYLHLALRVPIDATADNAATNSMRGAAPVLLLSEDDEEPDALLLAEWDGAAWEDRRTFSALGLLSQLQGDIGYDATIRALGSIAARLTALEADPADPDAGVTPGAFNNLKDRVAALEAANADLNARIDEIAGPSQGTSAALRRYEMRDIARLETEDVKTRPAFSLDIDGSVFVAGLAGNGEDYGNGVSARDVHSGNTIVDEERGEER